MDKQKIIEQIDDISTVEGITDFLDYLGMQAPVFQVRSCNGSFHFWTFEEAEKFSKEKEPIFIIAPYMQQWTYRQVGW